MPSLVTQACDPVLKTKDGGIKVVWKMVSADTNGLSNVAATDVFVCPGVPTMAGKTVWGSPLSYQSSVGRDKNCFRAELGESIHYLFVEYAYTS